MTRRSLGERVSRRTVLQAVGAVSTGVGIQQVGNALHRNSGAFDALALEMQMAMNGRGVAREIDMNKDGDTDVEVARADTDGREDVLQITSNGTTTVDYGFSVANVQRRKLTLGDLTGDGTTTYEYMAGEDDTAAVPDEVWLVLKSRETETKGRQYVCRTETGGTGDPWGTRQVDREITGDFGGAPNPGSGQEWKEFHRSDRELTRVGEDLTEVYGEEATVQGIGVGHGTPTTSATKLNVYYDNLVVAGESTELPD